MTDWNMYTDDCLGVSYRQLDPLGRATTFAFHALGNRTEIRDGTGLWTSTYDATNQLTREQRSGDWACDHTYAYDVLGNRLVKDATGALTTSTYDLANQLVTSQDAAGTTTYTYDLGGNLHTVEQTTGQRTTTTWDDQNRQTGVLLPDGSVVTNTYRFDGLRYSKQELQATTKFLWDVNNYLGETDAADEIQAVYTNEPQQYGNLISQYRKGPTLWLPSYHHYDALGSTRALTEASAGARILKGLAGIGQTLVLLPGAVLPTSLKGKLTASVIAAIADAAASGAGVGHGRRGEVPV